MICPGESVWVDGFISLQRSFNCQPVNKCLWFSWCLCFYPFFFLLTRSAQSLEKEVQEVKSTLQAMFAQLKVEGEEGEELNDQIQNGTDDEEKEDDDEEEDQYFSDSWDIWDAWRFTDKYPFTVTPLKPATIIIVTYRTKQKKTKKTKWVFWHESLHLRHFVG